jgi:zinc transport system permease protein
MAVVAGMIGTLSVVVGLFGSLHLDTPSGPSIVVSAMLLFLTSLAYRGATVEPLNHV